MSVPRASAAAGLPAGITAPTMRSPPTSIPWLGLVAVLMGTFISTLNGRLSTFGLADIRGAVERGVRRRRVDHHGANRRADVRHARGRSGWAPPTVRGGY